MRVFGILFGNLQVDRSIINCTISWKEHITCITTNIRNVSNYKRSGLLPNYVLLIEIILITLDGNLREVWIRLLSWVLVRAGNSSFGFPPHRSRHRWCPGSPGSTSRLPSRQCFHCPQLGWGQSGGGKINECSAYLELDQLTPHPPSPLSFPKCATDPLP